MHVKKYNSIQSFLDENLLFLEEAEAINNLLIGIPSFMLNSEHSLYSEVNLFSVFENEVPVFCLVQTPPKNYLIYGKLEKAEAAYEMLVPELIENKIEASGIIASNELAIGFANAWKKKTGTDWRINFEQLVYQLDEVKEPEYSEGQFRKATMDDLPLLASWFAAFVVEALGNKDTSGMEEAARKKIESETLFIWELPTGEIVSMAGVARPTRNGITVNYVYTPANFRGNGYASSCVAAVSKRMLEQYKFCDLFTDKTKPGPNHIYQKIGYNQIGEFVEVLFKR